MTERALKMHVPPHDVREFSKQRGALFSPSEKDPRDDVRVTTGFLISGRSELYSLRPGLRLISIDMNIHRNVELNVETTCSGMFFALALDGRCRSTLQKPGGRDDMWEFSPDRKVLGTFQPDRTLWTICGSGSHRFVELQMAADTLLEIVSEFCETVPGCLHPVLTHLGGPPKFIPQALTPEQMLIAHQVLNCPLAGPARRLFMEGKALEILALQLGALSSSSLRKTTVANRAERERLEEARRIPDTEYSDPPSLLDLSRSVGLNDFKLNRGFRDVYRTTAFGYIHELRMERALGYTCFGHFSVAFRKRFGMSPGAVKRAYGGK